MRKATLSVSSQAGLLNAAVSILAVTAFFLVLTNGLPLMQLGLLDYWGEHKKLYVRYTQITVIVFSAALTLIYALRGKVFQNLWVVRSFQTLGMNYSSQFVFGLFGLYFFSTAAVGLLRHLALETRAFDLGIFVQAVANTVDGHFLYSSLKGGINLMGDHVSPVLLVIAPVFALWRDPAVLILLQAGAAAACLPLLWKIANGKLQNPLAASVFALSFFLYYPTRAVLHEDFHPEVLVEPLILLAFYFMERKRWLLMGLCLAVVATGKENMLGVVFVFGLYLAMFQRKRFAGALMCLASAAVFFLEVRVLVPYLSGSAYFYQGSYAALWQDGPLSSAAALLSADRLEYVMKLLLPFLFLPAVHLPTFMLSVPVLAQNLLSGNEAMRSFNYHYTTGLSVVLFISSIYGYAHLTSKKGLFNKRPLWLLCGLLFVSAIRTGPSEYFFGWQTSRNLTPHRAEVRRHLRTIPRDASVLTHNNLIAQIADRLHIYQFDYTTNESKTALAKKFDVDYVILESEFWETGTLPPAQTLKNLKSAGYTVTLEDNGFYILTRAGAA